MKIIQLLVLLGLATILGCEMPSDELSTKTYTPDSLAKMICSRPKSCAETATELFFLDEGFVFSYSKADWKKAYRKLPKATELLAYKGQPILLNSSGKIYLMGKTTGGDDGWVDIGNNTLTIEVAGDDLVALTQQNGEVWRYQGRPGPVNWEYVQSMIPMQTSCGNNCTNTIYIPLMIPYANGHRIAFTATAYSEVAAISKDASGNLIMKDRSGRERVYAP